MKAYAGIRAQITNSVAHLLFESSVLKTKVACGHVQWNDNSVKLETRSQERGEKKTTLFAEMLLCVNDDVTSLYRM